MTWGQPCPCVGLGTSGIALLSLCDSAGALGCSSVTLAMLEGTPGWGCWGPGAAFWGTQGRLFGEPRARDAAGVGDGEGYFH